MTEKTRVVTGKVRLSYANVWEPTSMEGDQEKKYNTAVLVPKKDKATVKALQDGVEAAKKAWAEKFGGGKVPTVKFAMPLRDGDEEKPEDEAYKGMLFFNAKSKQRPQIIDAEGNEITILNRDEVYSGVYARVSVNFYPFNTAGNKGVGAGLGNIMKVADGEPLSGQASAADDFAEFLGGDSEDFI